MKLFSIFGNPVSHSRSPLMHNNVFKKLSYGACYTRTHLEDGSKIKETFFSLGLSGANVTVPHKEAAFNACDEVRGFAKHVGVVNTLINENGKLIGYNTDADGFMYAIKEFHKQFTSTPSILILGAGGTARALAKIFILNNFKVEVLNRSEKRACDFEELEVTYSTWNTFNISKYDLVVNTTSAGLNDEELPAPLELIDKILASTNYAADAIYGKFTPFLKLAHEKNIIYKDGADMLLGQGVLANELFVSHSLDKKQIEKYMKESFSY